MTNQLIMKLIIFISFIFLSSCNTIEQNNQKAKNLYDYDIEQRLDSLGINLKVPKTS